MNDRHISTAHIGWTDHLGRVSFQVKKNRANKNTNKSMRQALIDNWLKDYKSMKQAVLMEEHKRYFCTETTADTHNPVDTRITAESMKQALIEERHDGFVRWVELRKYNGMGDD